ncbi:MAG: flagellar biosynthetic protein FliO [Verrucomicrobiota bacterium]
MKHAFQRGVVLFWLGMSGISLPGQTTNAVALAAPKAEIGFSLLRVGGAFALVLALFFGGVWCFRNWQRMTRSRGRVPKLNVLRVKALGARQALYVVGYEQQRLLLASSPQGITLVSHLPAAASGEPAPAVISFSEAMHQALGRKS